MAGKNGQCANFLDTCGLDAELTSEPLLASDQLDRDLAALVLGESLKGALNRRSGIIFIAASTNRHAEGRRLHVKRLFDPEPQTRRLLGVGTVEVDQRSGQALGTPALCTGLRAKR